VANSDSRKIDFEAVTNFSRAAEAADRPEPIWRSALALASFVVVIYLLYGFITAYRGDEHTPAVHWWLPVLPWLKSFFG